MHLNEVWAPQGAVKYLRTSLWNLSSVSFLCIWSCTHGSAAYSPSKRDCQQFPASRFVFMRTIWINFLSSAWHNEDNVFPEIYFWSWSKIHALFTLTWICKWLLVLPNVHVASSPTVDPNSFPYETTENNLKFRSSWQFPLASLATCTSVGHFTCLCHIAAHNEAHDSNYTNATYPGWNVIMHCVYMTGSRLTTKYSF